MALSYDGRDIAFLTDAGDLRIVHLQLPGQTDSSKSVWSRKELLTESKKGALSDLRALQLTREGRLMMLLVRLSSDAPRDGGTLHWMLERDRDNFWRLMIARSCQFTPQERDRSWIDHNQSLRQSALQRSVI